MNDKKQIGVNTEAYKRLRDFISNKNYTSLKQINAFLEERDYKYSTETIQKYLKKLKDEGVIYSAGRGYYSTLKNTFQINHAEYSTLITQIKNKYPLLEFSLWSTKMLASQFQHMQNSFYTFIHAEKDALEILRDYLSENGNLVFLNPNKRELGKNIILKNNAIILRSKIERSQSSSSISSIEIILVDLYMELKKISLLDLSEYQSLFSNVIQSYRLSITLLLDYAQRRKNKAEMKKLISKYTNVTFNKNVTLM